MTSDPRPEIVLALTFVIALSAATTSSGLWRVIGLVVVAGAAVWLAYGHLGSRGRTARRAASDAKRIAEQRAVTAEGIAARQEAQLREYRTTLFTVTERASYPYEETQRDHIWVGHSDADDRCLEEYTTVPTSEHGLLFRSVGVKSQPAAAAAGGGRLDADALLPTITVIATSSGRSLITRTHRMENPDDERELDALVLFSRALDHKETLDWSADYSLPHSFDPLRRGGRDTYVFRVGEKKGVNTRYEIVITLPRNAKDVAWSLNAPQGANRDVNPVQVEDGSPTLRWAAEHPVAGSRC
jgi:hypothetical protein